MMTPIEFIKKSPKAELHLHIEGSLEPSLLFDLAKKNNISIPFKNINEVKMAYSFHNLESFLNIFSSIYYNFQIFKSLYYNLNLQYIFFFFYF